MRITAVLAVPVAVPKPKPTRSSLGRFASSEAGIVRVLTDDGVEGVGEISLIWHGGGARLCRDVAERLGPALVGEDPRRLVHLDQRLADLCQFGYHTLTVRAGLEMALHDLVGKRGGVPVYQLLGGKTRPAIDLSMSVHMDTPEAMLAEAVGYWESGFRTVKVKVGVDAEQDVRIVRDIRQALGNEVQIRIDANMGWRTAKEALAAIHRMQEFGILSVEQPLAPQDLDGLRLLRRSCEIPIMVDETVWSPADAWRVVQAEAADMLNVYVAESGGLQAARRIFDLADLAGIECAIGSMPEFGIGTAAQAHLGIAVPLLRHPSDVAGVLYQGDDLITAPLRIEGGKAYAPEGPGLGVEVDWEKVEFYRCDG